MDTSKGALKYRCKFEGCTKRGRRKGLCAQHGGADRCQTEGCGKLSLKGGKCREHGGGPRCRIAGCDESSRRKVGTCAQHGGGGGTRCKVDGCGKRDQGGGKCMHHGGGHRCQIEGCGKHSRKGGKCREHGAGCIVISAFPLEVEVGLVDKPKHADDMAAHETPCIPKGNQLSLNFIMN